MHDVRGSLQATLRAVQSGWSQAAARAAWAPLTHLHNPEECTHGLQVVVGWVACEQLNDEAAHRPDVRSRRDLRHLNHLHTEHIWRRESLRVPVCKPAGAMALSSLQHISSY